ncbi:hypothetical protein I350_08213 [Cryptococcus amylolentus CBS 6273]|uniref:Reverse transcriptase domain-containing protein n=1 Tax=Cryptococcus amylolentus CBS 6273 TaxID=1296118 RepID=A0A1E3J8R3_9TREE|nr:hypothetical protein I350_08213 [Cryptococcus amylolentus CBS 6273]
MAERVLVGKDKSDFMHLASLDASNVFSKVERKEMAAAVRKVAPTMWRLCKWAYGDESVLVISGNILSSLQGVHQGDPFDPLFFLLALCPTLYALSQSLGPDTAPMAYLNNNYLFTKDPNFLNRTTRFLSNKENVIKLNPNKSSMRAFEEIRGEGMKMLGISQG